MPNTIKATPANQQYHQMPEQGFLRLAQILGSKKTNTPALIPIGRTSFLNGVKSGRYPSPVKLGERTVGWRVEDIRELILNMGAA
jgi:predicted DNA-binding transcriptional regulator AlpA